MPTVSQNFATQDFYFGSRSDFDLFRRRALLWLKSWQPAAVLDSNSSAQYPKSQYQWLLAAGAQREYKADKNALEGLDKWLATPSLDEVWRFAAISYELKNEIEPQKLHSHNTNDLLLPLVYFFEPKILLISTAAEPLRLQINCYAEHLPQEVWAKIQATPPIDEAEPFVPLPAAVQRKFSKAEYLQTVADIRQQIIDGNVYEINFCQQFSLPNYPVPNPAALYFALNSIGKTPFAAYFRLGDKYLCSASPERYLHKSGQTLFSQPIKGTRPRGNTPQSDAALAAELLASEKDRAENLMIVDLVRNDLARICLPATVSVEELCALYTFPSVFQLVSSISGELPSPNTPSFCDILRATFPMGSMTGAPKIAALQLIDQYERNQRGWYSGAVGYIRPDGDFDFNVVIRSFLYDQNRQNLSWQVGGAIVYDSIEAEEYEECMVKMRPLLHTLGISIADIFEP
jgi:para-aminobenzoate synthetase component I